MALHRTRVGLHARNDVHFPEYDFNLVRRARIETMKMMSFTDPRVFGRLKRENPGIEFIVRLFDDRLRHDSRPSPATFVAKMAPVVNRLRPYATKFEIHNEPNHVDGIEAWGSSDQHAHSFRSWYIKTLPALRRACPWASFGFPGLALNHPHRDLAWLEICKDAIRASDWLGCHTYWQYGNMMKDEWGLRFKLYHQRFPNKRIEITEFGDSTPNRPRDQIARQYARYYEELNKYPYLGSASAFIASSPDPAWVTFVWMKEGGEVLPVVSSVGNMTRKAVDTSKLVPEKPEGGQTPEQPSTTKRTFSQTGKTVEGAFLKFFDKYGLDVCGYPITDQLVEDERPTQYFQRVALRENEEGEIRLLLIGSEIRHARRQIEALKESILELRRLPGGGAAKPPILNITDELPTHETEVYPTREMTDINQIVFHHTATSPTITPLRLAQYQVRTLNKAGTVYHFVIIPDGTIYQTNKLETVSDHAYSRNEQSVGVCVTGNFTNVVPSTAQIESGGLLCAWLLAQLRLPASSIMGLNEFIGTQSPGKQWLEGERWKDLLLAEVNAVVQAGGSDDDSALVESLRARISDLEDQVSVLTTRAVDATGLSTSALENVVDELAVIITSLQNQINALVRENAKLLTELEEVASHPDADHSALIESLRDRLQEIERQRDNALSDLGAVETALQAKDSEQSTLISSLRKQINSLKSQVNDLKNQITELTEAPTPPATQPVLGDSSSRVPRPVIQNMIGSLVKHETEQYELRPLSDIKTFVIHHSAVPASVGPKRIANYHVKNLDWPGIGYHFLVAEDGVLYQGNNIRTVSNHAAKVNPRGVGICFLGSFQKVVPPEAQIRAGAHLVAWLLQELQLDMEVVKGHKEFMQTACPGNQWLTDKKWKQMLRQEIVKVQRGESQLHRPETPATATKPIDHYMLFWHRGDSWARADWMGAQAYIAHFRPTSGFAPEVAAKAKYVTIVGGTLGVSRKVEAWLKEQGCKVDRLAGANEAATKQLLTDLIEQDRRFHSFDE